MLHPALDLAPDGVLTVEEAGIVEADEELAVGAVRVLRPGHRAGAANVRLTREFRLQVRQIRAVESSPCRIAALRHEAGDDTVEHDAVVETLVGERGNALDMLGRQVGPQLDDDVAAA